MLYGWVGNPRSGITLPIHHRLSVTLTMGLMAYDKHTQHSTVKYGTLFIYYEIYNILSITYSNG